MRHRVLAAVPDSHPSRAEALTLACRLMEQGQWDATVGAAAGDRVPAARPGSRYAADAELAVSLFHATLTAVRRKDKMARRSPVARRRRPIWRGRRRRHFWSWPRRRRAGPVAAAPWNARPHAAVDLVVIAVAQPCAACGEELVAGARFCEACGGGCHRRGTHRKPFCE